MLKTLIVRSVDLSVRRPWWIIVLSLALAVGSGVFAARHFAIKTDINALISPDLPWAQRALAYTKSFSRGGIVVVLDAPTPEIADKAVSELADGLRKRPDLFRAVSPLGSGSFFERNGLLFLSTEEVARLTGGLDQAGYLVGTLASDPSLRGALDSLSLGVAGVKLGRITIEDFARPLTMAADAAEAVLADRPVHFSWRVLASGKPAETRDLRRFIAVAPVLNFSALQPGRAATDAIMQIALDLKLESEYQVRLRQTGRIPIEDDEFSTITQNAGRNLALMLLGVLEPDPKGARRLSLAVIHRAGINRAGDSGCGRESIE